MGVAAWAETTPNGFTLQPITNPMNQPVAFGFTPGGRMYVALKEGTVQTFDSVSDLSPTPVIDIRINVHDYWDRGLLGFAVDPAFGAGSDFLYLLYTYDPGNTWGDSCADPTGEGCLVNGRLSRFPITNGVTPGTEQVLLTGKWCAQYPSHTIGDLAFTEDGFLLVSAGDGASFNFADHGQIGNPCGDPIGGSEQADDEGGALRSQDLRTSTDPLEYDGTVLRVNKTDGSAATGNPSGQDSRVVAYGLRNPFRITTRPGAPSEVWVGDVGWGAWEEVNLVSNIGGTADNFGWPCYEGNNSGQSARHGSYDGLNVNICENLYSSGPVVAPFWARRHGVSVSGCPAGSGGSISGLAFYEGGDYPSQYDGALFIADYTLGCIRVMLSDSNGFPDKNDVDVFIGGPSNDSPAAVDLQIGPGGDLYYADIAAGQIIRVVYNNSGPTAVAEATPTTGSVPLSVQFDGTSSTDPEGDDLTYAWDLDGDGAFDDSTSATPSRTYSSSGDVTVGLRVTDEFGNIDTDTVVVSPTVNQTPVASISAPGGSLAWRVGETVTFSGSATDSGQPMPASALTWEVILNHCQTACHEHTVQTIVGVASGSFTAPDHPYPSYLTIRLRASDGQLTGEDTVDIHPETSVITIQADPTGLVLEAGAEGLNGVATPYQATAIVGGAFTVNAPSPQSAGGFTHTFESWSDGGAQNHTFAVPAGNLTLTANFTSVGGGGGGGSGGGGGGGGGGAQEAMFEDVPAGHPFFAPINWLANQRITLGCTDEHFCPSGAVTRGEMAVFLARALALLPAPSGQFTDTAGSPYEWAISSIAAAGITQGCAADRYCPNDPVTREQMASFLVRAFQFQAGPDLFTDDEDSVHEDDINALAKAGVTLGCSATLYCPGEVVTREQMAAFIFRASTP